MGSLQLKVIALLRANISVITYVSTAPLPFHTSKPAFDSGGAGCTSTVTDYLKVVNVLINDGVGANGKRIITSETLKEMLKDQITDLPQKDPLDQGTPCLE